MVAPWSAPAVEATLATEALPICTTMTAMGSESDWAQLDPDFAAGKRALVAEDWIGAITALKLAVCAIRATRTLELHRLSRIPGLRNLARDGALHRALMLNPRHRGRARASG